MKAQRALRVEEVDWDEQRRKPRQIELFGQRPDRS
jgi:hypothetical protein